MANILKEGLLLNESGELNEAGYSLSPVKQYQRTQIKGFKWRIKEWDYYYVGNSHYGLCLTIADLSFMSMASITFMNFDKCVRPAKTYLKFFTFGKTNLPSSSLEGDVSFSNKKCDVSFKHENGKRHLVVHSKEFEKGKDLRADIILEETLDQSIVVATPFNKKGRFYYNQKINLMQSNGYVKIGNEMYDFNGDTFGLLDWGRGVWTYSNTWLWSSMNGVYKGKRVGFNLGYGFGDTSNGTENIFYYDGGVYKLNDVRFDIPISKSGKDSFMEPWKMRSSTGDINITFKPVINRHDNMNLLILQSLQNQVFGTFSGYVLVDGKELYFEDIPGFAEKVTNRW